MPETQPAATPPAQPPPANPPASVAPPAPAPGTPQQLPPAQPPAPGQPPPAAPAAPQEPQSLLGPDQLKPQATPPPPAPADGLQRDPATGQFLPKPLPIDLKLPEGAKFDAKLVDEFKAIMADPKTTAPQKAQALVEWQARNAAAQEKSLTEQMQRARVADLEQLKGDPEYGGAQFDRTVAAARSILANTKYGPAVSKKLQMYGLDCDPDFVKYNAEIRSLIAEDSTSSRLTTPTPATNGAPMSQTARQAATYKDQPGQ
jgi:hypothetical protein